MTASAKPTRGLVAFWLAFVLGVAACGGASSVSTPSGPSGLGSSPGSGKIQDGSLAPGLSAGLAKLDSYQFSWTLASSVVPGVSGTVVNKGTRSYRIGDPGTVQFIVVGGQAWTSVDAGKTWTTTDLSDAGIGSLLIDEGYATWFDKNAAGFKVAGEEPKNGVPCIHYQGDSSLRGLYASIGAGAAQFTADLWIAKDGQYPVSGVVGYSGSVGSKSGGFGFSFDVTHVNDPANVVAAPASVLVEPSGSPASS